MKVCLTEQLKLETTDQDHALFLELCMRYAEAATAVSEYYFHHHFQPTMDALHKELYLYVREAFGLKSQMAQSVMRTVLSRYDSVKTQLCQTKVVYPDDQKGGKPYVFYKDLHWLTRPIRFKRPQADLVRGRDWSFREDGTRISLNTLKNRVVCTFRCRKDSRIFDPAWKQGTGKLVYHESDKHWYFHVSVSREFPDVTRDDMKSVHGHDRGLINLTTTCDDQGNIHYESGKHAAQLRAKHDRVRASLQKKGTRGARRVLKRISGRENGFMNDTDHRISRTLAMGSHILHVLEDLTGISFTNPEDRSSEERHALRSWSFYSLEQKLSYKAAMHSSIVQKFDPHCTSQRCPSCGNIDASARDREKHRYTCRVCHASYNDDEAAARNIRELGNRYRKGEENPHY